MSDLVERLRQVGAHHWYEHDGSAFCFRCRTFAADWNNRPSTPCQPDALMTEAADEIERLRAALEGEQATSHARQEAYEASREREEQAERERGEAIWQRDQAESLLLEVRDYVQLGCELHAEGRLPDNPRPLLDRLDAFLAKVGKGER